MSLTDPESKEAAAYSIEDIEKDVNDAKVITVHEHEALSDINTSIDLFTYHERNAGRLVLDPEEAKIEFGEEVAKRLKLSRDGTKVLWPQPTDDPEDPQNWSDRRKNFQLFIITLAAIVPDFDSGIGIASIFALAKQYDTTSGVINDLTSNWSIFLLGWGSIFAVMLMRRYGRLPILFWSQVLALGFLIGCTFAPNLNTFTAMRCLTAFFGTCPQVTGLYVVTDLFPFHLQARKAMIFGFTTGINTTNAVFLADPPPVGYGFSEYAIAGAYGTPIIAVVLGELIGHFLNDWVMEVCVRRNNGVFVAEMRLWTCYVAVILYIAGFIVLGWSMEHLNVSGLILGWGIAQCVVVFNTVAVYAYCNDCFPDRQGEISALVNLSRTLGGFSVAYFQVPWATRYGALQTFGVEAAVVAALFLFIVPALQVKGTYLRSRFSA
ncbi:uncharacterized protein FIBRA_07559 [Fibroporia radiculosa]|uniref:Major facilitator superfamily (MFS) profile domain-containing protein n=1 Tax=Fibroporia radiculosa TaxID=599839 RepID=J4GV79_9APHY|nr:uncharacterized protein FIBRA_07559 [Fibroporia radiculosa]CCM05345.1 predicted protein [Fibroporia radiculosa]